MPHNKGDEIKECQSKFTKKNIGITLGIAGAIALSIPTIMIVRKIKHKDQNYKDQNSIYNWFEKDAQQHDKPLHVRSGWGYMSNNEFNDIIDDWLVKMNPPIKDGDSCFEMGCGVGC